MTADEGYQLVDAQRSREGALLRHNSDGASRRGPPGIAAGEARLTSVGSAETKQHRQRGRLACAVRAEESHDLALRHRKADVAQRLGRAEPLLDLDELRRDHDTPPGRRER